MASASTITCPTCSAVVPRGRQCPECGKRLPLANPKKKALGPSSDESRKTLVLPSLHQLTLERHASEKKLSPPPGEAIGPVKVYARVLVSEALPNPILLKDGGKVRVGRSFARDICLPADEVSRLHAEISQDEKGRWFIRDLNSTNGTYVNGDQVRRHNLVHGDRIVIGGFELELRELEERSYHALVQEEGVPVESFSESEGSEGEVRGGDLEAVQEAALRMVEAAKDARRMVQRTADALHKAVSACQGNDARLAESMAALASSNAKLELNNALERMRQRPR